MIIVSINLVQNREIYENSEDLDNYNFIKTYIFQNRKYTILEALIVYLREKKKLSFRKISALIKRDLRYTYNTYQNAKKKQLFTEYRVSTRFLEIPMSPVIFIWV